MDNTVLVMNLKDMLNKMQMQLNILFKLKKNNISCICIVNKLLCNLNF